MNTSKRLERLPEHSVIGGVAAGLADYFGTDRILIRALLVAGIFLPHFPALLIYVILWIVMPERRFGSMAPTQTTNFSTPYFSMTSYNPNNARNGSIIGGVTLILLGVFFLLDRWFGIDFGDLWPLILVAIGVWLLFRDRIMKNQTFFDTDTTTTPPAPPAPPTSPTLPTTTDSNSF